MDLLQAVLAQALRRSLAKYSELDREDDFLETAEAPDIRRELPGPSGRVCPACGRPWAEALSLPLKPVEPWALKEPSPGEEPRGPAPLLFPVSPSLRPVPAPGGCQP